ALGRYRGGFLDDLDRFDSLFFNISPREAETLDPQERLFLEVSWEALEDAGYYPDAFQSDELGAGRIGVYVGAVWAMYQMVGAEERLAGNKVIANSFLWSVANRVSYFMNFTGPSIAVDTACSASLTAIHLACDAIRQGECAAALVGGVNLDVHQCKQEITVGGGKHKTTVDVVVRKKVTLVRPNEPAGSGSPDDERAEILRKLEESKQRNLAEQQRLAADDKRRADAADAVRLAAEEVARAKAEEEQKEKLADASAIVPST
ncbi:beta-ketoacyl synthase N-terminal-like domain-containing protein, partial [Lysobacter sp. 2RAB21]